MPSTIDELKARDELRKLIQPGALKKAMAEATYRGWLNKNYAY